MIRHTSRRKAAVFITLLFPLGCGGAAERPAVPERLLSPGAVADSFAALSLNGMPQVLRFPSSAIVVLQVGAFDCELCRQQWEAMRQVADHVELSEVRIIAVTLDDTSRDDAIGSWIAAAGNPFEIWRDPERRVVDVVGLDGMPRLLVIARDGTVLHRERGVPTGITPRWIGALSSAIGRKIPYSISIDSRPE